ncbi:MAG TPA: HlyD family efflux transporter periplasmic adaptor subunit [Blastocatellia bacterium]|nr:HlyD family efflux transporter periplasmic adaptor subunit [Blastocatellia bacterium]
MRLKMLYFTSPLVIIGVAAAFFLFSRGGGSQAGSVVLAETERSSLIAAPGRVEPISEEIRISSEIGGKLRRVPVEEGDSVRKGQVVAVLENDDYRARVASAEARVAERKAALRRTINGARDQERREAWEAVEEARAVLENARAEAERRVSLYEKGVIAREESDRAEREQKVAEARYERELQRHRIVDDQTREEDIAKAKAEVALAEAELDEARARLEKSFIKSPIDGAVLRKHLKEGESVSDMRDTPIVTVANTSVLRVRVDVDETDVSKIRIDQRAYVVADAYGEKKFWGRVVRIGQMLGKKNIRTDEPTERVDTKILETLIELDSSSDLPTGLRVDAFIEVGK